MEPYIWRRRQDSNLHAVADERFSKPWQYQLCLLLHMRVLFFMRIPAHWVTRFLPRAGLDLLFINRLKMLSSALGGAGGIRTLARFYPPNPLLQKCSYIFHDLLKLIIFSPSNIRLFLFARKSQCFFI